MWREQEMVAAVAQKHGQKRPEAGHELSEDGGQQHERRGVLESHIAIDAAVGVCRWGHETEGLTVFGLRLGPQVLTSVAVVTAGQVVLFAQLILRHYSPSL
jgi:hypothetical protein